MPYDPGRCHDHVCVHQMLTSQCRLTSNVNHLLQAPAGTPNRKEHALSKGSMGAGQAPGNAGTSLLLILSSMAHCPYVHCTRACWNVGVVNSYWRDPDVCCDYFQVHVLPGSLEQHLLDHQFWIATGRQQLLEQPGVGYLQSDRGSSIWVSVWIIEDSQGSSGLELLGNMTQP